jgi:TetR/AcrR family transcriptional repressor of nem operon
VSATATRILDVAEVLVQTQGYNGFSYADISEKLGIRKASLHHHFGTKAALGEALIARYHKNFLDALAAIDASGQGPRAALGRYADLYRGVVQKKRMCLCGMLAAEYQTLPDPMRPAVIAFIDANEAWVEKVLSDGQRAGTIAVTGPPADAARLIVSGLEGAMLVARPYGDVARFDTAAAGLLATFGAPLPAQP